MKVKIYYYSGTGNSLWVSKKIADEFAGAEIESVSKNSDVKIDNKFEAVGFVFPVHAWGVPRKVVEFVERLEFDADKYYFAVGVNAGQVANTLVQFKKILKKKKAKLGAGYSLNMPNNYLPWKGYDPVEKQNVKMANALEKIKKYSSLIKNRESAKIEKGPFFRGLIFSLIYKLSYKQVPKMDQKFSVDEKCNGCEICKKVCPANNIKIEKDKPVWLHKCEQCLACIQWCPQEAIQYNNKSQNYKRYQNREINLKEMFLGEK